MKTVVFVLYEKGIFRGIYSTFENAHKAMEKFMKEGGNNIHDYEETTYEGLAIWDWVRPYNDKDAYTISGEIVDLYADLSNSSNV